MIFHTRTSLKLLLHQIFIVTTCELRLTHTIQCTIDCLHRQFHTEFFIALEWYHIIFPRESRLGIRTQLRSFAKRNFPRHFIFSIYLRFTVPTHISFSYSYPNYDTQTWWNVDEILMPNIQFDFQSWRMWPHTSTIIFTQSNVFSSASTNRP